MTPVRQAIATAQRTKSFVLHDEPLDQLPEELAHIPDLREIRVPGCGLGVLPGWLVERPLRSMDLAGSRFDGFPGIVLDLHELQVLGLSGVRIGELPSEIDRLRNLRTLVVSNCSLQSVPPSLVDLGHLTELDLGFNDIRYVKNLPLPPRTKHLVLSGNGLPLLPQSILDLDGLHILEISAAGNERSWHDDRLNPFMPRFVGDVRRTTARRSRDNRACVERIPPWLYYLSTLEWLDLTGQRISFLAESIETLGRLRGLILAGNGLRYLPNALFDLPSLNVLDVTGNQLEALPSRLANFPRLSYAGLRDNKLPLPPEVLSDPLAVKATWEYIARTNLSRQPLNEAKLLVVGEGSVGKSSIIRRLTVGDFDPDERKTEGIDVTHWSVPVGNIDITVNVWDFGGQEIMHATHQFFLTRRSVYLLVVDARQSEEQNRLEYWLKLIHGFSGGSPVILVGNKCEKISLDIDHRGLRAKYPNIADVIETSCADNTGIEEVGESLRRTLDDLPHVRDLLPTSFFSVKNYLEDLDADYLPYSKYEQLCRDKGVDTAASQELLIGFLHDLGTVLCFRKDPRLRDTNILNPSWVTGGVYRLLNSHAAAQAKGLLTWPEIDSILDDERYQPDKRPFIVEMMKKFELCFESDNVFLVPDLLTKEEPDTGSWDDTLHFIVRYGVLPSSILGRLVVRLHRLISQGTVWRTGVVLALDNNRALVKADREDATVIIKVSGPAKGRRGLLTAVRAELRAIERFIPGLSGEEQVPVPGHSGFWVPYTHLLNLESAGKDAVIPQGLVDEFPISQLLDGVEAKTDRGLPASAPAPQPSGMEQPNEERTEEPAERLRFLGLPKVAGIIALAGLIVAVLSALLALLSYLGDERERQEPNGSLPASAAPGPNTPASRQDGINGRSSGGSG